MLLHSPLSTVTPTVDGDVLSVLAGADDWFTVSRLQSLIPDRSRQGLRKTLARLSDQGVVDAMTAGTTRSYRLNRDHLAAPAIIDLASMKTTLLARLQAALEQWAPQPEFAALFGSAARGRMATGSDIDLFLLYPGPDPSGWDAAVDDLTSRASRWTGNVINALVMTGGEAQDAARSEPVLQDIADFAIPLAGDLTAFRRLTGAIR